MQFAAAHENYLHRLRAFLEVHEAGCCEAEQVQLAASAQQAESELLDFKPSSRLDILAKARFLLWFARIMPQDQELQSIMAEIELLLAQSEDAV